MKPMSPRERIIAALELRQPDAVPHFELEMQLTQEYFGMSYASALQWKAAKSSADKRRLLRHDAELIIRTADQFDYGIIFYSGMCRPTVDDYREGIRQLCELDKGRHLILTHGDATQGIPDGAQMDEVIVGMLMNPEKAKADTQRAVDSMLEHSVQLKQDGIEGFALCSDYCFNSGPYISPTMFSELITPFLTQLITTYRSMGLYTIKHTDGNIMPILDELIAAHPHAIHSLDPMAGVDIKEVKRLVGDKVCLIGNVNCALMQTGTREHVLQSCAYAMENGKPGGGYIFSTSNVIFEGMPKERYDFMIDYYRAHRAYA